MGQDSTDWRKSSYSTANGASCVEVATWRKSSYSGANGAQCVEVATWRKSTYSSNGGGSCVECATAGGGVAVRDTTDRAGATLTIPAAAWRTLLTQVRA